jgi:DNA (cytosine-5)-methyltransferase 1
MGYHRAGFDIVGLDIKPQYDYPFEFIRGDAVDFSFEGFDAIHASPPCQGYSPHTSSISTSKNTGGTAGALEPKLIHIIRERMIQANVPYVIENVRAARPEMIDPVQLCGVMFGLPIARHRLFETNFDLPTPPHPKCYGKAVDYCRAKGWDIHDASIAGKGNGKGTGDHWSEMMGIDWYMSRHELREAIPPAYTEYIGGHMMTLLTS